MTVDSLVRGYVLHQRPYRNTSMLVEAFTADAGRVGLVARGVRRQKSRTRPLLEPFQPLLMSWRGRGELRTLTTVEPAGPRAVPGDRALLGAYYCNELILRLIERDSTEVVAFRAYEEAVATLASGHDGLEAPLRRFELALLDSLGYGPELDREVDTGEAVRNDLDYDFIPDAGPARAAGAQPVAGSIRVPGAHLRALARDDLTDPQVLQSARKLLRFALEPLLGGRPLNTRLMYRNLYGGS